MEAYRLIGYKYRRDMSHFERDRKVWEVCLDFPVVIANELRLRKASASFDWQSKVVTVNDSLIIRAVVGRCRPLGDSHGWLLRWNSLGKPDITIIGRLAHVKSEFEDYFLPLFGWAFCNASQDCEGLNTWSGIALPLIVPPGVI